MGSKARIQSQVSESVLLTLVLKSQNFFFFFSIWLHLFELGKGDRHVLPKSVPLCSTLDCVDQLQERLCRLGPSCWEEPWRRTWLHYTMLHLQRSSEKNILPDIRIRNNYNCSEQLVGFKRLLSLKTNIHPDCRGSWVMHFLSSSLLAPLDVLTLVSFEIQS